MSSFGNLPDGRAAEIYTLTNSQGAKVSITNYGGIVVRVIVPDRDGRMADIVLGHDKVEEYIALSSNFGAIVGRYANRIARGSFVLDGKTYSLPTNSATAGIACTMHGGQSAFHKVLWDATPVFGKNAVGLRLRHLSRDGEGGFPGNLDVTVTYWFTNSNELRIEYIATADKPTPINLTNHSYFNLRGDGHGDISDHWLQISASKFVIVDKGMIPTGELASVAGTPFDFTKATPIGKRIAGNHEQLKFAAGYDHTFVLESGCDKTEASGRQALIKAAEVYEPDSGRVIEVFTDQPGMQFYSGNFLDGTRIGKSKIPYVMRSGFCLETQHYPDSPNHPNFPNTVLRPGKAFESVTIYHFATR